MSEIKIYSGGCNEFKYYINTVPVDKTTMTEQNRTATPNLFYINTNEISALRFN